jgi:DedD protein
MVDTRVKERLTGAIILVALLVLLVPELLSGPGTAGEAHPPAADGQQMRSYTIDLADDATARRPAAAPLADTPMPSAPDSKPVEASANDAQPARGAAREAPRSGGAASVERAPGASAPNASTSAAATAGSASPRPSVAAAAPSAPRAAPSERPVSGGWAVQVGSFASRENAERLARKLKGKGFESHVSESSGNGKRLWRVRVGPEPDRASAVALGTRLRAAGQSGTVVSMP